MELTGHIEHGQIVLDEPTSLADGTRVRVNLVPDESEKSEQSPASTNAMLTFYERHKSWIGSIRDAPPDFARNHDHYIHGTPKK